MRFLSTIPFFITFMRALNFVKAACFTTDYRAPNYREVIGEFGKCIKELHHKFKISKVFITDL